ncbi:MAG: hypothetical protein IKX31_09625 [Muribaculaceae bacterium]|nr:hypothetical protein [Muribaculaceae bacterium]
MRNFKTIITVIAMVLLTCNAKARTMEIKMSQCPKPYVENIRNMTANLGANDVLILNFDKAGKYEFDGSLKFKCNTVIKGLGPNSTKVVVKEGFVGGKSKMLDDTFFAIHGSSTKKVKAEIRDISFELASHKGILWEKTPKHIVKVWYGDGVVVDNIVSKTRDAVLTNLDLRECSNVLVQNSEFENYNNCNEGGCLWSRGEQRNILIRNNIFIKYGNDEALGCWGGSHKGDFVMNNIVVEDNEFYLDNKMKAKQQDVHNFIAFNHSLNEHTQSYCTMDSIIFRENKITINAPLKRIIIISLCKYADVKSIEISNNEIIKTSKCSTYNSFMNDIDILSELIDKTNITIDNNSISSSCKVLMDGNNTGSTFISCRNAKINISNNVIENDYPQRLLWCQKGSINLNITNNTVSNVFTSATLSSSIIIDYASIRATGNTFSGDTRIYCRNVKDLYLVYKNNVFNSSDNHFFLQEGAEQTSIIFENNIVNALTGKGRFFASYDGRKCDFRNVTISNNTFNGLSKQSLDESFKNVGNKTLNGNIYR